MLCFCHSPIVLTKLPPNRIHPTMSQSDDQRLHAHFEDEEEEDVKGTVVDPATPAGHVVDRSTSITRSLSDKDLRLNGGSDAPAPPSFAVRSSPQRVSFDDYYGFNRRLSTQAELISKLQDRLLDYKRRMTEMEHTTPTAPPSLISPRTSTPRKNVSFGGGVDTSTDELMVTKYFEEHERSTVLQEINTSLRQDLDEARGINQTLLQDYMRLNREWERSKRDFQQREETWRNDERSFISHLNAEHQKLLDLWRILQLLRREFAETKSLATRNLAAMNTEIHRAAKSSQAAVQKFSMWQNYAASNEVST